MNIHIDDCDYFATALPPSYINYRAYYCVRTIKNFSNYGYYLNWFLYE